MKEEEKQEQQQRENTHTLRWGKEMEALGDAKLNDFGNCKAM